MNLDFIEQPIVTLLKHLHGYLGNYGLAIISITIIIKILLLPLTLKQDKSMKEMRRLQPEIEKIKEKFKDNQQEQSKQMMELYQKHQINPMAGCLPAILQLPVLWGLYNVLMFKKVIPLDAHFLLWNLTKADPLYILPVLNAGIAYFQQKLMTQDPQSQNNEMMKMMGIMMPIMIGIMSFAMPAGLQIYWLTSSLISLLQQYFIFNRPDPKVAIK